MPRTKRVIPYNAVLHVVSRGNNRQKVFHSENDKLRYYTLLKQLKEENKLDILHYCIMDNHVHLILKLNTESSLSKFMKQLNLTYFCYYRKLYNYIGHLWQDRFKSNIIELDSYLFQCGKYIELNPVRAGVVDHPSKYLFSSYSFYARGKTDTLLTPSPIYLGLSDSAISRQKQYIDLVIDDNMINSKMLRKKLYIGSKTFVNQLQEYYKIKERRDNRGRPSKE
jgi:putative transposase